MHTVLHFRDNTYWLLYTIDDLVNMCVVSLMRFASK